MTTNEGKILVSNLQIGMYIYKLDRPWLETPFPFQGFYIRTKGELSEVQRFCDYVYISIENSIHNQSEPQFILEDNKQPPHFAKEKKQKTEKNVGTKPKYLNSSDLRKIHTEPGRYDKQTKPFKHELKNATRMYADISNCIEQLSFNIRVGKKLDVRATLDLTRGVVTSVINNPNTMICLSLLKNKGDYTYNHSLRSSVLAIVFGRYLGLDEKDLNSLASAVLLADIGKSKIPRKLLNASHELSKEELEIARSHVSLGIEMLAADENVEHSTLAIVETHHERFNGSGYPYGLVGNEIPYFGQIAGLVDLFDAISSKKSYGQHLTPAQAMDWLYNKRGILFSSELIDDFVQAIGLYPPGSVVELTDNSIALVVSHNQDKRLRPEVLIFKDHSHNDVTSKKTIDLSKRALFSRVDRPMVNKALLPEDLGLTGIKLSQILLE